MRLEILMIIAFSATIGSFLNVCIYRIPAGMSIAFPASHCPRCQTKLKAKDLIPLISWLTSKGKCRYCHTQIPSTYFWVEAICTLSCLLTYSLFGLSYEFVIGVLVVCLGLTVGMISLSHEKIPEQINLFIFIIGTLNILFVTFNHVPVNYFDYFSGTLACTVLTAMLILIETPTANYSLFISAMGLLLGLKLTLLSLWIALVLGIALTPLFLINYRKYITRKFPVIPILVISLVISCLFGNNILACLLNG